MRELLDFLRELELNNNREWFDLNRKRYEALRKKFLEIAERLIAEIRLFDEEIPLLTPKDCVFRIFRDVRFSNDKRPYKNNFGCFIARGGKKGVAAGYYLHIQPGESFLSGGVYMPDNDSLQAIRQEIYYHPEAYLKVFKEPQFQQTFTTNYFDQLKSAPKGYPRDWEHLELIKNRSYAVGHPLTEEELCAPDFFSRAIAVYRQLHPYNHFLNRAMDENRHD